VSRIPCRFVYYAVVGKALGIWALAGAAEPEQEPGPGRGLDPRCGGRRIQKNEKKGRKGRAARARPREVKGGRRRRWDLALGSVFELVMEVLVEVGGGWMVGGQAG
jgi:hypothetical protein